MRIFPRTLGPFKPQRPRNQNGVSIPILNVGTGMDCSIKEIADQVANVVNTKGNNLGLNAGRYSEKTAGRHTPYKNGMESKISLREDYGCL